MLAAVVTCGLTGPAGFHFDVRCTSLWQDALGLDAKMTGGCGRGEQMLLTRTETAHGVVLKRYRVLHPQKEAESTPLEHTSLRRARYMATFKSRPSHRPGL